MGYSKFLMFCVFLPGLMITAQVFEYEKGEGSKSVPPPLVLRSSKNAVSIWLNFSVAKFGILYFY